MNGFKPFQMFHRFASLKSPSLILFCEPAKRFRAFAFPMQSNDFRLHQFLF